MLFPLLIIILLIILLRQPYLSNHSSYSYDFWINPLQILPTTIFSTRSSKESMKKETLRSTALDDMHHSLIDLALLSDHTLLQRCDSIPPLNNSDHNGLELVLDWKGRNKQVRTAARRVWLYNEANFEEASNLINAIDWGSLMNTEDINSSTQNWSTKFLEIMAKCIPQKVVNCRKNVPWLSKCIIRTIRKRNGAFQSAKRSHSESAKSKYKKLHNKG